MIRITKWILIFVCCFGYIHAQNTTIYFNSSLETPTIGSQFNLTCKIESTDLYILYDTQYITRNGVTVCEYFDTSFVCRDAYNIDHFSRYRKKYTCGCVYVKRQHVILNIAIQETSKEDNGTWVCDARTINETLSVIVKYPPSINNITIEPNEEEIKEGSNVKLSCLVDSFPQSNITWSFNGVQVKNDGPDFIITNAKCDDSGKYTCWAENGVRSKASKTQQIDVNCSPRVNPRQIPQTQMIASLEDSMILTATVMAYPVPTFTWKYLLEDKSEKTITDWRIQVKSNGLTAYLNIVNITEQDFGNYIMYAKNKEGEISVVFTLNEVKDNDTVSQDGGYGDSSDNKLGTGIGIGFIVGLLVSGIILAVVFFVWKKRGGSGINLRQLMSKYKKKPFTRGTVATETAAPSTRQTSSTQPTTVESNQTYEGLDMNNSPKQTYYEELNIYENQGVASR